MRRCSDALGPRKNLHMHIYEVHAHEMHACEVHAYEMHAHEKCAHETNARGMHAYEGFCEDLARQNILGVDIRILATRVLRARKARK
jgi:hypothetical protein